MEKAYCGRPWGRYYYQTWERDFERDIKRQGRYRRIREGHKRFKKRVEVVKNFITETVGLARYLEDNLPSPASDVFSLAERGEASILVPQIVMGNLLI